MAFAGGLAIIVPVWFLSLANLGSVIRSTTDPTALSATGGELFIITICVLIFAGVLAALPKGYSETKIGLVAAYAWVLVVFLGRSSSSSSSSSPAF